MKNKLIKFIEDVVILGMLLMATIFLAFAVVYVASLIVFP